MPVAAAGATETATEPGLAHCTDVSVPETVVAVGCGVGFAVTVTATVRLEAATSAEPA